MSSGFLPSLGSGPRRRPPRPAGAAARVGAARFNRGPRGRPRLGERLVAISARGGAPRDVTPGGSVDWPAGPWRQYVSARDWPMAEPRRQRARRYRFEEGPAALAVRVPEVPGAAGTQGTAGAPGAPAQRLAPCLAGAGLAVRHVRLALRRGPGPVPVGAQAEPARQASAGGTPRSPPGTPSRDPRGRLRPRSPRTRCGFRSVPV